MKKIRNPYIGDEADGYNCFACAPHNPSGLKMEFFDDGDDIVCFWKPTTNYQGWINTLHGATIFESSGTIVLKTPFHPIAEKSFLVR